MKPLTGRAFGRLLERHGWSLLRVSGSHHVCGKSGRIERLSVPIHGNKELKRGLQSHLAKLAGLTPDDIDGAE
jgi:predicted RNA binding protein YcfA (HicA-like mRNA interferase family)